MTLERDYYTYRVTWSSEDNESVGLCEEFPSLSWLAAHPKRRWWTSAQSWLR